MNLVEDFLANADLSKLPAELSTFRPAGTLLLSSPRVTSSYATALLLDSTGTLRVVAKIARRPHHPERLAAEFELLQVLTSRYASDPNAPLPLALAQHRDHWLLLESAVVGTALDRHSLVRSPRRMWERVEEWLLELTNTTATVERAWHAEQIVRPMRQIEGSLPATSDERRLFAVTESLTQELTSLSMPAPIEHGDLFKAHLVVARSGSLSAIDWELGRPEGLPGGDASIFLFDVFRPPAAPWNGEATAGAYAKNFLDPRGVARQWLQEHLERQGIERSWVNHILLATLARRALQIWEPVLSETCSAPAQQRNHVRSLFRGLWTLRLWRMTLAQMERDGQMSPGLLRTWHQPTTNV